MKGRSWRTTLGGFLAAAGIFLVTDYQASESIWVKRIGQFMAIGGTALTGLAARDNNVTSEQVKACKQSKSTYGS